MDIDGKWIIILNRSCNENFGSSWPEAMSNRSPRSITGRDQNGLSFDLGNCNVPNFAEILNVLNKGSGEESLDFLRFLTLPPTHHKSLIVSYSFPSFYSFGL